jgi:hypothetical protein
MSRVAQNTWKEGEYAEGGRREMFSRVLEREMMFIQGNLTKDSKA